MLHKRATIAGSSSVRAAIQYASFLLSTGRYAKSFSANARKVGFSMISVSITNPFSTAFGLVMPVEIVSQS